MDADLLQPFKAVAKAAIVRVAVGSGVRAQPRSYAG
jgi:hypothetical protein